MVNNSSLTDDTLIKLQMHKHNKYYFHESPSIGYLVMAEDGKIIEI